MNSQTLPTTLLEAVGESLEDRHELLEGRVYLNGNQALIRLFIEQMRRDRHQGLRTRSFITGYPGSPLGGIDIALQQIRPVLERYGIRHQPGQNEELAATSLSGTQMLDEYPNPDLDGVVGYWYGKGPGLDRSGDAIKHGNFSGTSRHGAVVILSGEDHEAKSSSVPYQMEFAFEHHGIPVLYPSSVQEFVDFGLHAVALSRYSGCWVAMKLVGALCDGGEVVRVSPERATPQLPALEIEGKPFAKSTNHNFFPVVNIATERQLYVERHAAVLAYARANQLNQVVFSHEDDRIGIITAGKSYADTRQALEDLGLTEPRMQEAGIRLAKIGLLAPLDGQFIRDFARGLKTVIVIEEKRDFLERQVGHALCGIGPVTLMGKLDAQGQLLFPVEGGMNSDIVGERLARALQQAGVMAPHTECQLARVQSARQRVIPLLPARSINFCSGCPHNISTVLAPGQKAWGAPGCHIIAATMDRPERKVVNVTQLGGEGLPWIGLSPFTARKHIVQNVGDGALFHSSYQNIRYAVDSGVNITFKLLLNGVVANTGGQNVVAGFSVPTLIAHLLLDRVRQIVLITKQPERYRQERWPAQVSLRATDEVEDAMRELEAVEGVTVLIYDGECANERRRRQKRGKLPPPKTFTFVNEEVCENCGDCGQKANCMSLQKVDTEFGRKTQIHQSSCNQDQNCVRGECPSFVSVEVQGDARPRKPRPVTIADEQLADVPVPALQGPYHMVMPGLGGTGVLTASAILAQAASMDGMEVKTYDQTGAAQKWGAVLSSMILSPLGSPPATNRVGAGKADLYLALDLMAGIDKANLASCHAQRTVAVVNSNVLPNGAMIRDPQMQLPAQQMVETILEASDRQRSLVLDARVISEGLFGDYVMTNMVAIGAAWQAGLVPIRAQSIEAAIRLNGAQVETNILAFRAGRLSQSQPQALQALLTQASGLLAERVLDNARTLSPALAVAIDQRLQAMPALDAQTQRLARLRAVDLVHYQGMGLARRYLQAVERVALHERAAGAADGALSLTATVIRNLHKVMAYKDEYEVARLLTQQTFAQRVAEAFTGQVRLHYMLQPPLARLLGMRRKKAFGPWFRPVLRGLAVLKFLRGTPFDPFGRAEVRQQERALVPWYENLLEAVLAKGPQVDAALALELLSLPESVRGYEEIKLKALGAARERAMALLARLA